MPGKNLYAAIHKAFVFTTVVLTLALASWAASDEVILHSFKTAKDVTAPFEAGVIADAAGNLYGVAQYGGTGNVGGVYKLTRAKKGNKWTEKVIYNFKNGSSDGWYPTSDLVFDKAGNLYGVTTKGGTEGGGIAFELTPTKKGAWQETVLHNFNCNSLQDGCNPDAPLIFDGAGNLYGETNNGLCAEGGAGCGTVFELSPSGGTWSLTILQSFGSSLLAPGGTSPSYGLIMDKSGNLYGGCSFGGPWSWGVAWELSPTHSGWVQTILWQWGPDVDNPADGGGLSSPLIMDSEGNLYGTTAYGGGGAGGGGVVYELSPAEGGGYNYSVLHGFAENKTDSDGMYANGIGMDAAGNIYGTASAGGGIGEAQCSQYQGCGVVFKLAAGSWTETILHDFTNNMGGGDGGVPFPNRLLIDSEGNIYGTTQAGGASDAGTVFEIPQ